MEALYDFSSHYFERHGVESAGKKWEEVKGQMEKVVTLLDSLQGTVVMRAQLDFRIQSLHDA